MQPLRVLHVAPYYEEAWAYGGIPRVVAALARGSAARGHRVTVVATDVRDQRSRVPATERFAERGGVAVRLFPNLSNRLAYRLQLYTPRGMRAWLRAHAADFDVAHLHGCHHLPGVLAARALRRAGVPYVITPNGTAPRIERRRAAKWLFDITLGRDVLPRAARVLTVSAAERRQLERLGVARERLRVVPNPLAADELAPPVERGALRARLGIGDAPLVLFLGVLSPRKGADVLIEAFARLRSDGARLVIAGNDGGMEARLRRRARALGIAERTTFLGLLRGAERAVALADADVVAYPSRDEVFGLVPLEALLCGVPVVVGDDHGCGEVVAEIGGGRRVPPGDVEALAAALREILAAPARWREEATAAAVRVRERFAPAAVCARAEAVYAEVAATAAWRRAPRAAPRPLDDFLLLVPARDEAASIAGVLAELRARWPDRAVLVVDDASRDGTATIATASGARALRLGAHLGVGGAVRAGLRWAERHGYTTVVRLDADGQHPADQIAALLAPILAGRADAVQGARAGGDGGGFRRRGVVHLGQRLLAALLSWRSADPVRDPTSGLWAFGPAAVRLLAEHHPTGYPEPELLLLLRRNGLGYTSVPVVMRARAAGRTSLTLLRTGAACWRVLLAALIVPLRTRVAPPPRASA